MCSTNSQVGMCWSNFRQPLPPNALPGPEREIIWTHTIMDGRVFNGNVFVHLHPKKPSWRTQDRMIKEIRKTNRCGQMGVHRQITFTVAVLPQSHLPGQRDLISKGAFKMIWHQINTLKVFISLHACCTPPSSKQGRKCSEKLCSNVAKCPK